MMMVDAASGSGSAPQPPDGNQQMQPYAAAVPEQPRLVLVAEDEHLLAEDLKETLLRMGYRVVGPAVNGQEALDLAKAQRPDLALLDIRMPVMDGLAAASVLFCQMSIPVVIVSAFSDEDYVQESARIGVFGYVLKPVTADRLRVALATAWSRYRQHAQQRAEIQQLKLTLEERKIIEKAKGILMRRLNLAEDEAFSQLRRRARDSRRKMADMARAILETEDLFEV